MYMGVRGRAEADVNFRIYCLSWCEIIKRKEEPRQVGKGEGSSGLVRLTSYYYF